MGLLNVIRKLRLRQDAAAQILGAVGLPATLRALHSALPETTAAKRRLSHAALKRRKFKLSTLCLFGAGVSLSNLL